MSLKGYIITSKSWLIESIDNCCKEVNFIIDSLEGKTTELNFNEADTLFFIDHVFISNDLIDVNDLKHCKWVLLTDRVLVHYLTLVFPPIDYIHIDLPKSEICKKLESICTKLNLDSGKNRTHNLIPLTDIKRNVIYQNINLLVYAEGLGDYARIYTLEDEHAELKSVKKINIAHNLKYLTDTLKDRDFFRVHRSYIVNLNYLESKQSIRENLIILKGGIEIPIARRRKKELIDYLESFNTDK